MPVLLDQKVTVLFSETDLVLIDAIAWLHGSTRSHLIRSRCLSGLGTSTEYHLTPKSGAQRPPPCTVEVIERLKAINEMDNDLSVKLRVRLGVRKEFIRNKEGKAGALQKLNEMIPEKAGAD